MAFFATLRSASHPSMERDLSTSGLPQPPRAVPVDAAVSLPRHLLVSLAGITAEVSSLQRGCADTPELQAALGTILGRLDGLVDTIYERVAGPAAPSVGRSGLSVASLIDGLADLPADTAQPSTVARSLSGNHS